MMPLLFIFYLIYYGALLLTCAITGCRLIRRHWAFWARLLVILSCVTFLVEALIVFLDSRYIYRGTIYTFWLFLETACLLFILSHGTALPWGKRLFKVLLVALPPGAALCFILLPFVGGINIYAMLLYLFLELAAACTVLIDILTDVSDKPMHSKPMFWLAAGMLFYCSIFIVIYSLGRFIRILYYPYYIPFSIAANTFMYGGFIACFVTLRRMDRKALQE
ncbi:MAG TPA: hypothetical protein VHC48_12680 [Puia sp.]|nr:hypothetical protein [Puia sp.]